MPEIRVFREETDADLECALGVYNAVHPNEPASVAVAREYERQSRAFAGFLAEADGVLAGAAHVRVPTYADAPEAQVYVLEGHRRRGVGRALYEAVSGWAVERGATALESWVGDDDPESLAWVKRRGFRERSRQLVVELDLAAYEPRSVEPPPGVEIVTWAERPGIERELYGVAREALADIPDSEHEQIEPFDVWLSVHMKGPLDRPEATFVAVAGEDVVGFAKLSYSDAMPDTPFNDLTGVKRAWRGRGIARALKHAQLAWAKEQGFRHVRTGMERRNEPIRRLNEQLGYEPIPGRIIVTGPLDPGKSVAEMQRARGRGPSTTDPEAA